MSYIIDCPNGGTVVIDGGMYCEEDAEHLYRELEKRGKGSFKTLITRRWMAEMQVLRSFHLGDGDWLFR